MTRPCLLALEDGTVFVGSSFGAVGTASGEVVFNTAMTGYQEILTDPSYSGQIVTMTAPHIGNYGINAEDMESERLHLRGFVVKEVARRVSNHRAQARLSDYLRESGVVGLSGIDTRSLTRHLRERGAQRGVISSEGLDADTLVGKARASAPMLGLNLVKEVTPEGDVVFGPEGGDGPLVVVLNCGIKLNIVRKLVGRGCRVRLVPGTQSPEAVLEQRPRGLLVGNGPGDPAAVTGTIAAVRTLIGRLPIFGICLGHQLVALALGANTYKLKTGHHGANHPVLNVETGCVEITSHNHGFAVDSRSLEQAGGRATHVSLYDRSLEGFRHDDQQLFSVQYHPEAAPGPHDSDYLFSTFVERLGPR
jgi:carbamoyl-phosphate synthase small subunit